METFIRMVINISFLQQMMTEDDLLKSLLIQHDLPCITVFIK